MNKIIGSDKIERNEFKVESIHLTSNSLIKVKWKTLIFKDLDFTKLSSIKFSKNKLFIDTQEMAFDNEIINIIFINCAIGSIKIDINIENFSLKIKKSIVEERLIFEHINFKSLSLENSILNEKVKIQFCKIKEKANFHNTKFVKLADFYKTEFSNVDFSKTDFENISVFSEVKFNKDIDFKYTKFIGKSIFRDTIVKGKLNLRNTIFDDDANFLDITSEKRKKNDNSEFYGEAEVINVANRETARIIKNFYDKSNNIIEANKFYKKEMQKQQQELKFLDNPFKLIIFTLHELSSDHSQNWFLALGWILIFAILHSCPNINYFIILSSTIVFISIVIRIDDNSFVHSIILILWILTIQWYFIDGCNINIDDFSKELAKNLNFVNFKIKMTLADLGYKIVMGYLIYQFIVSVRQDTRRK